MQQQDELFETITPASDAKVERPARVKVKRDLPPLPDAQLLLGGMGKRNTHNRKLGQHLEKRCQFCKRNFLAFTPDVLLGRGRFCSHNCFKKWLIATQYRVGHAPSHGSKSVPRVCRYCGKTYKVKPSHLESGKNAGKYCSNRCFIFHVKAAGIPRSKAGKRDDLNGQYFRSRWEANWARYLNWLIKHGQIRSWEFEPDTFEFKTIKRGTRFYTPDFKVVENNGEFYYQEVKGWMDPKSKTRLDRMARFYPEVRIQLVDKNRYSTVARQMKGFIPNWE